MWVAFAASVLGEATTAEIADLAGVSLKSLRKKLSDSDGYLQKLGAKKGLRWRSKLTFQQVGQLHWQMTEVQVAERRRKILEARHDFHEQKYRYLAANGLFQQAVIHLQYAERYEQILEAAA